MKISIKEHHYRNNQRHQELENKSNENKIKDNDNHSSYSTISTLSENDYNKKLLLSELRCSTMRQNALSNEIKNINELIRSDNEKLKSIKNHIHISK